MSDRTSMGICDVDPATLVLVLPGDPVLERVARPVAVPVRDGVGVVPEEVAVLAARMIELCREHGGIGLAANQVGVPVRVFVTDIPRDGPCPPAGADGAAKWRGHSRVYINPELSGFRGAPVPMVESCLTMPGKRCRIFRRPVVTVSAVDERGRAFTRTVDGLVARCVQHEVDHLDGIQIADRVGWMPGREKQ